MNKDVVLATIQESLLSTESKHRIKALIHMNKAAKFAWLYTILIVQDVQGQQNTIKVDRTILLILHLGLWLLIGYGMRSTLTIKILQHELMSVSLSLAKGVSCIQQTSFR